MSSSPFPILDNRPIDKWKVTELKEELKRRRLTTQGLKVDLVRRLDDALRAEQQESQMLNTPAALANQQAEIANAAGVSFTPDRMPATPVALVGAGFSSDTTPSAAAETTPVVKTTTAAIEITPPPVVSEPVVSKPEVNASGLDDVRGVAGLDSSVVDDVKLQEPQEADAKDGVGSGVAATDAVIAHEQSIQKSNEMENKAQPADSELEKAATDNQVSVTGYEVKSDYLSTDSVPTNEKMDNEIAADDVKLEQSVNKSQDPSTVIGDESHPMDVEKSPERKASVGDGDVSDAANAADMTKGNNNNVSDAGDSEKLNLDRSSGDESMEDEPESKQTESVTSHEVVDDKSEKNDIVDTGKGEAPEDKSHPLVASEKRKLPGNDQEAVVNNEPVKRQRRWNSGSVKVPEAQAQATNSVATPTTTPKSTGLKRDFSRSNSSVSEDGPKERVVPPSSKEPTDSLRIDRFLRPFTLKAVQELLGKTGNVTSFWMDSIKTHCYVSYASVEEAAATREAVYNLQWPPNGGRLLTAEFVGSEEVKAKLEPPPPQAKPQPQAQAPSRPPATTLPPPPPLAKAPPVIERVTLPPPPPLVTEEQEAPIVTLDDLFKKTKAIPRIYYLPLSEDQVAAKLAANNNK